MQFHQWLTKHYKWAKYKQNWKNQDWPLKIWFLHRRSLKFVSNVTSAAPLFYKCAFLSLHHQCYLYWRVGRCLHDTRSSFIPVRLHPGSILSIYICLLDTNQNCIPERVIPERLHPGSRIGSKFSFQNEICLHVPPVSCKGGTGSFRYGNKQVDWLGWPADSCFRSVDAFTAFSFQNENVHVNVKQTMRVVLEWNSFRYHVNTT